MIKSAGRKKLFVNQLLEGQRIEELFLVAGNKRAETKAGKPYLILTLMDKSGEIGGRLWDRADYFATEAPVGSVVLLQGSAQSFRDELQLKVDSLKQVAMSESGVELSDYLPACERPVKEMLEELVKIISSVNDTPLRKLLQSLFKGKILDEFSLAPAAKKMHHAYLGGLLEHTLSVTALAGKMAEHYPKIDRDIFLAGALLHDLGKIREFSYSSVPFDYTDAGRLLGHMMIGSELVREHAKQIKDLAPERLDQLIHLILSHHGRHEFGAPVLPMTLEAILLHHMDDIDAKVNYIGALSEKMDSPGQQWSDYQRPLERFLLLTKSAKEKNSSSSLPPISPRKSEAVRTPKAEKSAARDLTSKQRTLF